MSVSVFSLFLSFTEKEYQTESNELKIYGDFYGPEEAPEAKELGHKSSE